jgi:hypothetical protein
MLPVSQMSLPDYLMFSELSRLSQLCPVSLGYCVSTENCLICLHGGVCVDLLHMVICKGGLKKGKKLYYNFFSFFPFREVQFMSEKKKLMLISFNKVQVGEIYLK